MNKLLPLLFASIGVLAALPAHAQLPMKIRQVEESYSLTVPDTDTTKSAFGGELRRYDVHIAKMYEVTAYYCRNFSSSNETALTWDYLAGNGSIKMGRFVITCEETDGAFHMTLKPGTAKTVIHRSGDDGIKDQITVTVPTLGLDDPSSARRWMGTVQRIKPIQ